MTRPLVYTPDQVAAALQCSAAHVRAMCARGEIASFRLGGKLLRIRADDLEALICPSNTSSSGSEEAGQSAKASAIPSACSDGTWALSRRVWANFRVSKATTLMVSLPQGPFQRGGVLFQNVMGAAQVAQRSTHQLRLRVRLDT